MNALHCCIAALPQACRGVKDDADVTASDAEHMGNEPIGYSM